MANSKCGRLNYLILKLLLVDGTPSAGRGKIVNASEIAVH